MLGLFTQSKTGIVMSIPYDVSNTSVHCEERLLCTQLITKIFCWSRYVFSQKAGS